MNLIHNQDQHEYDFSGTNIKTPVDKMRAHSVINAPNTPNGLSLINFNLSCFIKKARTKEICHILSLWATAPIKKNPHKFISHPKAGEQALKKRAETLLDQLSGRHDMSDNFIENCEKHMFENIEKEIRILLETAHKNENHKQTA